MHAAMFHESSPLRAMTLLLLMCIATMTAVADPCTVTPSVYWSNTVSFPADAFLAQSASYDAPRWVKFTIMTCDPDTVYYQDSIHYTFHRDFVANELDPYLGITAEQFDTLAMHAKGQELIVGAVLIPLGAGCDAGAQTECGIQLIRSAPYTPDEVISLFNLVRDTINADCALDVFYMPTYEQWDTAEENREYLAANGVEVSSANRWAWDNPVYSNGWAIGRLKFFPGDQIEDAYLSGALEPTDILLTDGVPAEVPYVAGILSLLPATPNSHVAILANTYSVPFGHLAISRDAERAQQLVGRRVALRAYNNWSWRGIRIVDVEEQLDAAMIAEILQLKEPPALNIDTIAPYGGYSAPTDGLQLSDIRHFGGKASNFGFLRRVIPDYSPTACALSFDVWNEFLDQTLPGNVTLRDWIRAKLAPHTWPPNMAALADDLDDIRDLIKDDDETFFSPQLQNAILTTLQDPAYGFDPYAKIRFRSSTNVEDAAQFTGAGLYDSKSGCLMDDLDGDTSGPSHCEPDENREKGVFRAIRRVFASFYLDNAYLERLRHGVNEDDVGMAILVHHSFPDEFELANGVATLSLVEGNNSTVVRLVTQKDAVSVANPEGNAIPEGVTVRLSNSGPYVTVEQYSSLVVLGETVMNNPADYVELAMQMKQVAQVYAATIGETSILLDFEYKKLAPGGAAMPAGGLVIKQVRRVPRPDNERTITPFLINEPVDYTVLQNDYVCGYANHRLKSDWHIETRNMWMSEANLAESIFADVSIEYTDGCSVRTYDGSLPAFPFAWHAYDPVAHTTTDGWTFDWLPNPRHYRLVAHDVGELVSPAEPVWFTLSDLGYGLLELHADYDTPEPPDVLTDSVLIGAGYGRDATGSEQERTITHNGITINTRFHYPVTSGLIVMPTRPLGSWIETRIEGVTSEPIVLHDWYAQSYRPHRHNFSEQFVFEPRLDPDVPAAILAELDAHGVQVIQASRTLAPEADLITLHGDHDCLSFPCGAGHDCGFPTHDRFCSKPFGDCGAAGTCAPRPLYCDATWDPICGCDGVTYPNECLANHAGVSLMALGPCTDADLTGDGSVNPADVAFILECLAGPDIPVGAACLPADLDLDGDVDPADVYRFQWLYAQP